MKNAVGRLVAVNLFWGLSFPLVTMWHDATRNCPGGDRLETFTLIAVRYTLAAAIMTCLWPGSWRVSNRRAWRIAAGIGLVYSVGATLQVFGLLWATPAESAFITSLGGAWVPLLAYCWWRNPIRWQTWLALALAIAGVYLLSQQGAAERKWTLGLGETLTLIASVLFAAQIVLLDRYGRGSPPTLITLTLAVGNGIPAVVIAGGLAAAGPGVSTWLTWSLATLREPNTLLVIGVLTIFSTILAFFWMNKYQPLVPANRAALIYFLEPVFGTAFSLMLGYDKWSPTLLLGGSLIIGANVLAEPSLWQSAKTAPHPREK